MNIKYILTHPIQYQSPLIKYLYKNKIKIKVLYRSNWSVKKYYDPEFKRKISWGTNLLNGYKYEFLNYIGPNRVSIIFPLTTDFITKIFDNKTNIIWVHGIKNWYNIFIIFIAKILKKKVFVRDEATHFSKNRNLINKYFNFIFYFIIDFFVDIYLAIGSQNKKYYIDNNKDKKKIVLVPYVVDNNFFKKKNNLKKNKKLIFLFAAKFVKKKGADLLLKAIKILNQKTNFTNDCNFLIVGDGYMKNYLKDFKNLNNLKNIKFLPFKNQKQLSLIYNKSDVFVMPSLIEPWGLTVNEAMAAGNAIISSDNVGSSFDLVENGINGYKFKNGNEYDLAKKILQIYQNKNKLKKYKLNSIKIISKWNFNLCLVGINKAINKIKTKKYPL